MNRHDFLKLIGSQSGNADYIPVACLLKTGYGVAGYFNTALNDEFTDTCVLINARVVELNEGDTGSRRGAIHDFNEFLEEIVGRMSRKGAGKTDAGKTKDAGDDDEDAVRQSASRLGKAIPLTALSFDEIAVLYPVSQITTLMQRVGEEQASVPTFLDFDNRSIVLKLLRTRLW